MAKGGHLLSAGTVPDLSIAWGDTAVPGTHVILAVVKNQRAIELVLSWFFLAVKFLVGRSFKLVDKISRGREVRAARSVKDNVHLCSCLFFFFASPRLAGCFSRSGKKEYLCLRDAIELESSHIGHSKSKPPSQGRGMIMAPVVGFI